MIPPADAPVMLAGSSIFQEWALAPPDARSDRLSIDRPVLNAAIGGTQTVDWLGTLGPLVAAHRPAVLCLYVGSNDLANRRPVAEVTANLDHLLEVALAASPHTRLLYAAVIRSRHQAGWYAEVDHVNAAAAGTLADEPRAGVVDFNPGLHRDGEPDEALFREDGVHL